MSAEALSYYACSFRALHSLCSKRILKFKAEYDSLPLDIVLGEGFRTLDSVQLFHIFVMSMCTGFLQLLLWTTMCSLTPMETFCDTSKGYEHGDKCRYIPFNANKTKHNDQCWEHTSWRDVCPRPRKTKRIPDDRVHSKGNYVFQYVLLYV